MSVLCKKDCVVAAVNVLSRLNVTCECESSIWFTNDSCVLCPPLQLQPWNSCTIAKEHLQAISSSFKWTI